METYSRMKALGIILPVPQPPNGTYIPLKRTGNLIFTSGAIPTVNGVNLHTGKVGKELTAEQGQEAARQCILNILSRLEEDLKDLNNIKSIVKVTGFIASAQGFNSQGAVMNAASQMLIDIFGSPRGEHARTSIGVNELPGNVPVEIEMVVEV